MLIYTIKFIVWWNKTHKKSGILKRLYPKARYSNAFEVRNSYGLNKPLPLRQEHRCS